MTFTFIHHLFLWLLPLAAAPVIFHLFFRMKKRPHPFPSLMFFHRIDPKLSARQKIMEWLILLLRCLAILFLLLALSKPVWFGAGATGSVARVVVLDNSGSMSGRFKGEDTKLKAAQDAAVALVSSLKEKDSAGVVLLVDDPTVPLPQGLVSDRAALKTAVSHVKETEATGAAGPALDRALAMLENSAATRYEIHILTDLQENEWNKLAVSRRARAGTVVVLHRIGTAAERDANVSLLQARLPERKILAARRIPMSIDLANMGVAEARGRLNWTDDQGNRGTLETTVPARAEKSVLVLLEPQNAGLHWVNVWYEGDSFTADNKASLAFAVMEKRPVLFAGKVEDFGLLPFALAPASDGKYSGLIPEFMDFTSLAMSLPDRKPVFVVVGWESLGGSAADLAALRKYVEQGGNLLVTPLIAGTGAVRRLPNWLGATASALAEDERGWPMLAFRPGAPVFADLRNAKGELALRTVKVFKCVPLQLGNETAGLLGLEDGRTVLAQQPLGKGMVFLSGIAFDPVWSTLPLKGGSLALYQNMALLGEEAPDMIIPLTAGERLMQAQEDTAQMEIRTVTGSVIEWRGESAKRPAFPRTGVYSLAAGKKIWAAHLRASAREGQAKFILGDQVPALGSLAYSVRNFSSAESVGEDARRMQSSLDLFLPMLLLAVVCLALEGWLANQPPRKPREKREIDELRRELAVGLEQAEHGQTSPFGVQALKDEVRRRLASKKT